MTDLLGLRVRDKITGFEGVVTGVVSYITGCSQALVAPAALDGAFRASEWIDKQRLDMIEADRIVLDNGATPGFDRAPARI